jgi:signal transduction histidine kinase
MLTDAGKPLWQQWSTRAIFDEHRHLSEYQSAGHDITARKQAEQALMASRTQLRNLSAHLQAVREEERTTIAREIHDELGQALTALKLDLAWLKKHGTTDVTALLNKIAVMEELINSTLQSVKRISTELRPGLLDDLGLSAAIEWQAQEFQRRTGIHCDVFIMPEEIMVNDGLSTAVFRIFQETLTNVVRHAKATALHVLLRQEAAELLLEVRDNGAGITTAQIDSPSSFGLIGIRERVQFLGGEVVFQGIADQGTTVTVTVPL